MVCCLQCSSWTLDKESLMNKGIDPKAGTFCGDAVDAQATDEAPVGDQLAQPADWRHTFGIESKAELL